MAIDETRWQKDLAASLEAWRDWRENLFQRMSLENFW
jgi:hypothetical protein